MKKFPLVLMIFVSNCICAQKWLDLGAKGGYGVNLLYNNNFFNDREFNPKLSYGYCYGGKIGFNFNEEHSITLDVVSSVFNQAYTYNKTVVNPDSSVTKTYHELSIGFSNLDFLLLYRKMKSASYVEVGPQYSLIVNTRGNDSQTGKMDVSPYLVKSYYAIALGFGGFVIGSENFGALVGLRISYALNDILNNQGQQIHFPSTNKYSSYSPSNPVSALMILEFNYDLGYLASSKCGKKTKFLMF